MATPFEPLAEIDEGIRESEAVALGRRGDTEIGMAGLVEPRIPPQSAFWITQNRFPSGSARTTKSSSGSGVLWWIVAPSPTIRSISASRASA
jgi:hypothetical protein